MVLNDKQKYLKNLIDIINMCEDITKDMDESIRIDLMTSFQQMIIYIGEQLENDQDKRDCKLIKEHNIIEKLENLCEEIYICSQIFSQNTVDIIKKSVSYIIEGINNLPITYRVAFLPYKASMWDSLESIWKAFANDEKCETSVVPIPYYEANSITGQWEYHYDGSIYPEDVPIVDYKNYILSEKKPDFIFFHNPYDDYNYVTKVHPDFFSKNLKKYCRKLVYVPYYANMGYLSKDAKSLPALHRADYLIFQSDAMKEGCLEQPFYERILTFGSPKFDKVLRYMAQKVTEPEEWGIKDVGKKKLLLNTTINDFLSNGKILIKKLYIFFENVVQYNNKIVVIWRPHPLLKSTIKAMRPQLLDEYENLERFFKENGIGIYDDTADVSRVVAVSDVYIGSAYSSIIALFEVCNKLVYKFDSTRIIDTFGKKQYSRKKPEQAFFMDGAYFSCNESEEYTFDDFVDDLINKRMNNVLKKQKEAEKGIANNLNGTCGEKVHEYLMKNK